MMRSMQCLLRHWAPVDTESDQIERQEISTKIRLPIVNTTSLAFRLHYKLYAAACEGQDFAWASAHV